jgi:hypothetical protein
MSFTDHICYYSHVFYLLFVLLYNISRQSSASTSTSRKYEGVIWDHMSGEIWGQP